jgi:hypothetical protein
VQTSLAILELRNVSGFDAAWTAGFERYVQHFGASEEEVETLDGTARDCDLALIREMAVRNDRIAPQKVPRRPCVNSEVASVPRRVSCHGQ